MMELTEDDRGAFLQLEWATQALAMDAERQLSLFPDFVDKPFELVDDYDTWFQATRWRRALPLSLEQRSALQALADALEALPPTEFTEEAVRKSKAYGALEKTAVPLEHSFEGTSGGAIERLRQVHADQPLVGIGDGSPEADHLAIADEHVRVQRSPLGAAGSPAIEITVLLSGSRLVMASRCSGSA